ncbi:MAG: T9SS type A sorting domain-containing protein [Ignavibacteriales bacterium]|nr:T9SS type A sorting domain-containing protein [Ignavibacteriales bacterium]
MRIAAILLFTVMLTSLALSQISLTSSDVQSFYGPGKSWRYLENSKLSTTLNMGTPSSLAQSWTLPTITYTDTVWMDNVLPSATPYASKFPRATHAQRAIQTGGGTTSTYYSYFRMTTDSLISLGDALRIQRGGTDTTEYTFQSSLYMVFPFTYGKSFTSRDSIPIAPGSFIIHRSTSVCDAFGTLMMPGGTFQALRMKQTSISQTIYGGTQFSSDTSVQFSFITKEGYFADISPKDKNPTGSTIPITGLTYYSVIATPTGIADQGQSLPTEPILAQNYPNPFNPATAISYQLPSVSFVTLKVYDVLGKEVASLVEGVQSAGNHMVRFDGSSVRSGVYFCRLQAGSFNETKKLILVK